MCKLQVTAVSTLNLILQISVMSVQPEVLADSPALNNTTATKEFFGLPELFCCSPTQVHIAIGDSPSEMRVTRSTRCISETLVRFGFTQSTLDSQATGSFIILFGIGLPPSTQYMHSVTLKGLMPGTNYYYTVGGNGCESRIFEFLTVPTGSDWPLSLIVFGDMGTKNAVILPQLQEEITQYEVDAIFHLGDFAYDLSSDNSRNGDQFMNQIESIAALVAYMTCPGNHDILGDFSEYKVRFPMPNYANTQSMYYSWNMGPVHFISICTEYYFFPYSILPVHAAAQYSWLVSDLQEANKNRKERPWIIVYGHRPFYCSNDNDECGDADSTLRIGINIFGHEKNIYDDFGLEKLFKDHKVDVYLCGHEHSYERLWPTYNRTVQDRSPADQYRDPDDLVQFIVGSAGNTEGIDRFPSPFDHPPSWSAFRSEAYGYLRMNVCNDTLSTYYVSVDEGRQVIDSITITKEKQA